MACVVCNLPLSETHFANSWEKARKLYPCCSAACAQSFDPDIHWLPSAHPECVDHHDEARLVGAARERLRAGDRPSIVVRDLLIAGVGPDGVRKVLRTAGASADADAKTARRLNVVAWVSLLLGGRAWWFVGSERMDPKLIRAAEADIERWTRHFER